MRETLGLPEGPLVGRLLDQLLETGVVALDHLLLLLAAGAEHSHGAGLESGQGDGLPALPADAERTVVDPIERCLDLAGSKRA